MKKTSRLMPWLMMMLILTLTGCQPKTQEGNQGTSESVSQATTTDSAEARGIKLQVERYTDLMQPMFDNEAFKAAWQDYVTLISQVSFADGYTEGSKGTTMEEFDQLNSINVDYEKGEFGENAILRMYAYESQEAFDKRVNDEPGKATIFVLFKDDNLVYMGLVNHSFLFSQGTLLDQSIVESLSAQPFAFKDLQADKYIVTSFGVGQVHGHQYTLLSLLSGVVENPIVEYFALQEDQLDYITSKSLSSIADNQFTYDFEAYNQFITTYSGEFYQLSPPTEMQSESEE